MSAVGFAASAVVMDSLHLRILRRPDVEVSGGCDVEAPAFQIGVLPSVVDVSVPGDLIQNSASVVVQIAPGASVGIAPSVCAPPLTHVTQPALFVVAPGEVAGIVVDPERGQEFPSAVVFEGEAKLVGAFGCAVANERSSVVEKRADVAIERVEDVGVATVLIRVVRGFGPAGVRPRPVGIPIEGSIGGAGRDGEDTVAAGVIVGHGPARPTVLVGGVRFIVAGRVAIVREVVIGTILAVIDVSLVDIRADELTGFVSADDVAGRLPVRVGGGVVAVGGAVVDEELRFAGRLDAENVFVRAEWHADVTVAPAGDVDGVDHFLIAGPRRSPRGGGRIVDPAGLVHLRVGVGEVVKGLVAQGRKDGGTLGVAELTPGLVASRLIVAGDTLDAISGPVDHLRCVIGGAINPRTLGRVEVVDAFNEILAELIARRIRVVVTDLFERDGHRVMAVADIDEFGARFFDDGGADPSDDRNLDRADVHLGITGDDAEGDGLGRDDRSENRLESGDGRVGVERHVAASANGDAAVGFHDRHLGNGNSAVLQIGTVDRAGELGERPGLADARVHRDRAGRIDDAGDGDLDLRVEQDAAARRRGADETVEDQARGDEVDELRCFDDG